MLRAMCSSSVMDRWLCWAMGLTVGLCGVLFCLQQEFCARLHAFEDTALPAVWGTMLYTGVGLESAVCLTSWL
jgi:hypothetical protein